METNTNGFKVGDAVVCNGYDGKVTAVTSNNMIEVRLASGTVCVDPFDDLSIRRVQAQG